MKNYSNLLGKDLNGMYNNNSNDIIKNGTKELF